MPSKLPELEVVVVDPLTIRDAAIQIEDELERLDYPLTPQLEHTLEYLKSKTSGGRTRIRKNKRANKKSRKTRGRK